ncbi:MAG: IS630 family transposase, partial [Flammeovirgaceae bacterium]
GVRALLPCAKSKNMTILGFMNQENKLFSYAFEGAATSEVVIKCMDDFCKQITKKTVIILDNATIHKSNLVKSKMKEWKQKGLWLQFIPAYCPELNLIELLWKQLKYKWTRKEHYNSFEQLWTNVCQILKNVGTEYRINFS